MKQNIFLGCFQDWLHVHYEAVRDDVPGVEITANYEQVKAMVRSGEVAKPGIFFGVAIGAGRELAEDLHKVDPSLPILVWDGNISSDAQPEKENELYLSGLDYELADFKRITRKFYAGTLSKEDVPVQDLNRRTS